MYCADGCRRQSLLPLTLKLRLYSNMVEQTPNDEMIKTTLQYLARDKLYEIEKPYRAEFDIEETGNVKSTNHIFAIEPVVIHAIQPSDNFELDKNGFCVLDEKISLDVHAALTTPDSVESAYLQELEVILSRRFPEYKRLEPVEFVVRKRDERFPSAIKAIVSHEQPASLAHSDYSVQGSKLALRDAFPGQEKYFEGRDYDIINVWRSLTGPNDDWPLAVCDYKSIDIENDVVLSDRIHVDRIGESQLLHPNKRHRWYYIAGQQPNNLIVFRNTDSTGRRPRSFHCAFFNPGSHSPPRQSCEARFVAFR